MPPAVKEHWQKAVRETEADREEILEQGRAIAAAQASARKTLQRLRGERVKQGLSLADMRERTGMSREAISRLENDDSPNPTLRTLQRYATALGLDLRLSVRKPKNA